MKEEKIPAHAARKPLLEREGARLLAAIPPRDYCCVLTERGSAFSSPEFARFLGERILPSGRNLTFVIGGALGLSPQIYDRADLELSLSPMTLPHRLARLVLLEQIYRCLTIIRNEPYHK